MLLFGILTAFLLKFTQKPLLWKQVNKINKIERLPPLSVFSGISEKMGGVLEFLSGQQKITESNIEATLKEIRTILIDADVNLQVTNTLISKVKEKAIGMKVEASQKPGEQFINLLAAELVEVMGKEQDPLKRRSDGRPSIILLAGLQGAGKTTVAGKLANWCLTQAFSKKILLVAADIYRPAAIEQLQTLGARIQVDVFTEAGLTPVQISRKALTKAIAEGYDTVIIDTAGRQVVDARLMDELKQIKAAVTPDDTLLVVDAMTGQEAATLTARFNDDVGITGAILTKLDGDTRGGAALSVRGVSGRPIKFIGVGEGLEDLEPFFPDRMASRILGMGDIKTMLEKAQQAMSAEEALEQAKKMQTGSFDFNDFLAQTQMMRRMGGLKGMLKNMPGGVTKGVSDEQVYELEQKFKRYETIINAMTPEERSLPDLIAAQGGKKELMMGAIARRKELSQRAAVDERVVETFISEFNSMRKMMRQQFKGADLDTASTDPTMPMGVPDASRNSQLGSKKDRKTKPTRGGGGGFGAKG